MISIYGITVSLWGFFLAHNIKKLVSLFKVGNLVIRS